MPKFVIRMTHGKYLTAAEVVKETAASYIVKPVEECLFSHLSSGRIPRDEIVFVTEDKAKLVSMMALYLVITRQHSAVVDAAEKAYRSALDVILVQQKRKTAQVNIPAERSSNPT